MSIDFDLLSIRKQSPCFSSTLKAQIINQPKLNFYVLKTYSFDKQTVSKLNLLKLLVQKLWCEKGRFF